MDRRHGRLHRQGGRPQRRPGDAFRRGPRAVQAGAARSGALLRATPARRGASFRHRHAPRQAQKGICAKSPGRDRRHWPVAQARSFAGLWNGQGGAGAGLADLEKTPGFSAATARLVFDHFHDKYKARGYGARAKIPYRRGFTKKLPSPHDRSVLPALAPAAPSICRISSLSAGC